MASGEVTAVTTQPRSKRKEIEQFVRDLDPTQVVGKDRAVKHGNYLCLSELEWIVTEHIVNANFISSIHAFDLQ